MFLLFNVTTPCGYCIDYIFFFMYTKKNNTHYFIIKYIHTYINTLGKNKQTIRIFYSVKIIIITILNKLLVYKFNIDLQTNHRKQV